MNFLKRAALSANKRKMRVILTTLLFAVIFMIIVGVMMIFTSSSEAVSRLEKGLSRAVTMEGAKVVQRTAGGVSVASGNGIDEETLEIFTSSPYVETYNYTDIRLAQNNGLKKIEPIDEPEEGRIIWGADNDIDAILYAEVNSEYDIAFTLNGYTLTQGHHLSSGSKKNACMVSEELLAYNNLKIGDKIGFFGWGQSDEYLLEITGVFKGPEGNYLVGYGGSPQEIVFINYDYYREIAKSVKRDTSPSNVTVFLKSADVNRAAQAGIINGNDGKFRPKDTSMRVEVAQVFLNLSKV